ncbi:MAG TPA: MFS transporter [Acidimicrobiales bacterium]|jgi:EmrB/QacA subfamily drug resistance transporter|nr:MFS transporter [Acidimicrobiales bacterium]
MVDRKWWTLTAVSVATFMLLLDITIVNIALPDIQRSLHSTFSDLQWVVDAYALTLAAVLLVSGSVADRIGRRLIFVIGLVVFSSASLLCGLAVNPLMLTASRALQGIGGAMMFATSLALIAQAFRGPERATAFGIIGAVIGAAVAVGPLLGGVLTDSLGWQSIFLVNVPIGVLAVAFTLRNVAESRDVSPGGIDWPGAITFSGALALLVYALIRGNNDGWTSPLILGFLIGAGASMVAFVTIESRRRHPMLDLSLFRKPAFVGASTTAFLIAASMFSMFLYISLYLQNVLGYSPLKAGLVYLPVTVLAFVVAPIAGKLSARLAIRIFLGGGLALVGIALVLMGGRQLGDTWTGLLPGFLLAGIGIGMINPPLASAAVGVVEPARSGMASGINNTFRQVGFATGIAYLGALFQSSVQSKLGGLLAGTPAAAHTSQIAQGVAAGGSRQVLAAVPPQFRGTVSHAANQAFISSLNELFIVASVTAFVGAVLAAVLVRQRDFVVTSYEPDARPAPVAA